MLIGLIMDNPNISHKLIKDILRIRSVEQAFLDLFTQGRLNGTVHTCIGQELSALAFAGQLKKTDFVFSNHRCHGHFIAYTKEWKPLIQELMGKKQGVCSGVGSSQHLQMYNFYSNGIQGGIMPLAAGFALGNKIKKNSAIGVVYIGDGTLGEGVVYETLNFISKKQIPLLVVCENNGYAQSTPISYNLAGSIEQRARAFGLEFRVSNTLDGSASILAEARESIDFVRSGGKPLFHLVNTYRLRAHSKGDDDREVDEIREYERKDILYRLREVDGAYIDNAHQQINDEVWAFINGIGDGGELGIEEYFPTAAMTNGTAHEAAAGKGAAPLNYKEYIPGQNRQIQDINASFHRLLEDERTVFLGEDILDPYGGAFKVSKGLSTKFPDRVIGTSISEGLIAGASNGLALNGFKPYAEFMFGDFTALAFDQMVNHAAKVYNMYNKQISCPVVFRTPMGGRRGYGPTHSQSLEKHFIGMDMFEILALNKYLQPDLVYQYAHRRVHPTLIIENKVDYGKKPNLNLPQGFGMFLSNEDIPNIVVKPKSKGNITTTIIAYGGVAEIPVEGIGKFFYEYDELVQVLILTKIDPLPDDFILGNIPDHSRVITLEEGSKRGSIGNNIISLIAQNKTDIRFSCVTSLDCTIPSVKSLEESVLVNEKMLLAVLTEPIYETN
jgi:2-oxoisovalerate dehydrogenase E1 component